MKHGINWLNANPSKTAVTLAELKVPHLARQFFTIIQKLAFRPVQPIGKEEKLSSIAIASCISLAKDEGFQWFWQEYLDGRRPLNNFEEDVVADILGFYIINQNYTLPTNQLQLLNSLIAHNKHVVTTFCYKGFPVLALLPEIKFTAQEKALLLANLLHDDFFGIAAEGELRRLHQSATMSREILNALEMTCARTEFSQILTPATLWLEFYDGRPLSMSVLKSCLSACTKQSFGFIYTQLIKIVLPDNLRAFLRFIVLSNENNMAGDAALFLLWAGQTDAGLLNPALSRAIDWLTHRYDAVADIAANFRSQPLNLAAILAANVPTHNHLGVQPSFWRLFLEALLSSEDLFLYDFQRIVRSMSLFTLTRYPDVRL